MLLSVQFVHSDSQNLKSFLIHLVPDLQNEILAKSTYFIPNHRRAKLIRVNTKYNTSIALLIAYKIYSRA